MDFNTLAFGLTEENKKVVKAIFESKYSKNKTVAELLKLKIKSVNEAVAAENARSGLFQEVELILNSSGVTTLYKDNLEFAHIIDKIRKGKYSNQVELLEPLFYALHAYKDTNGIKEPYEMLKKLQSKLKVYDMVYKCQQELIKEEDFQSAKTLDRCYTLPQSHIRGYVRAAFHRKSTVNPLIAKLFDNLSDIDRLSYANFGSYTSRNGRVQFQNHIVPVIQSMNESKDFVHNGNVYRLKDKKIQLIQEGVSNILNDGGKIECVSPKGIIRKNGKLLKLNESVIDDITVVPGLTSVDLAALAAEVIIIDDIFEICIPEIGLCVTIVVGESIDFGTGTEAFNQENVNAVYNLLREHGMQNDEIASRSNIFESVAVYEEDEEEVVPVEDMQAEIEGDASEEESVEKSEEEIELEKKLEEIKSEIDKIENTEDEIKDDDDVQEYYAKLIGKKELIEQKLQNTVKSAAKDITDDIINESMEDKQHIACVEIENFCNATINASLSGDTKSIKDQLANVLVIVSNANFSQEQKNNLFELLEKFSSNPDDKATYDAIMGQCNANVSEELGQVSYNGPSYDFTNAPYSVPTIGQGQLMFKDKVPMTMTSWASTYECLSESELQYENLDENKILLHDGSEAVGMFDISEQCFYHQEPNYDTFKQKYGVQEPQLYCRYCDNGGQLYKGKPSEYFVQYPNGKTYTSNVNKEKLSPIDVSMKDLMEVTETVAECPVCHDNYIGGVKKEDEQYCGAVCANSNTSLTHGKEYLFKNDVETEAGQIVAGTTCVFDKDHSCFCLSNGQIIPFFDGCENVVCEIANSNPNQLVAGTTYNVCGTDRHWKFIGKDGNALSPLYYFENPNGQEAVMTDAQVSKFIKI